MRKLCLLLVTAVFASILSVNTAFATMTFSNGTDKPVWVDWAAAGCVGVTHVGAGFPIRFMICKKQKVEAGQTVTYDFPWGTSAKTLTVYGSKNNTDAGIWFWQESYVSGNGGIALPANWGPKKKGDAGYGYPHSSNPDHFMPL